MHIRFHNYIIKDFRCGTRIGFHLIIYRAVLRANFGKSGKYTGQTQKYQMRFAPLEERSKIELYKIA